MTPGFARVGEILMGAGNVPFGPKVWYRAETLAASLSDGDPVILWPDISGNGYDAEDQTGVTPPTFRAADLNGLATVEWPNLAGFVGLRTTVNELTLQGNAPTTPRVGNEYTAIAVFLTTNAAKLQTIVNGDDQTSTPPQGRAGQWLNIVGTDFQTIPGSAVVVSSGETVSSDVWYTGEAWVDDTHVQALLDDAGNAPTALTALGESGHQIYLGYHPATSAATFQGKLAEFIGWGRKLTTAEHTAVLAYLTSQYGL